MGILKQQEGFAMMEVLVSIVIICLIAGFTVTFFVKLMNVPRIIIKREAFMLVNQEISTTIDERNFNDTSYLSCRKNIRIEKRIELDEKMYHILVKAINKKDQQLILSLKADIIR